MERASHKINELMPCRIFMGEPSEITREIAKSMAQATKAILQHYSSTVEKPQHEDCPKGQSLVSKRNSDKAYTAHIHNK